MLDQRQVELEVSDVGLLTLDDGECLIADILEINNNRDNLTVNAVSGTPTDTGSIEWGRSIPVSRVVSFEPRSRSEQKWPLCDPCRSWRLSGSDSILVVAFFLAVVFGGLILYFAVSEWPYGFQAVSAVAYTAFEAFFTFRATRGFNSTYALNCPAVRTQFPHLLWRHIGFLAVLVTLQTLAITVRPNLPEWWNSKGAGRRSSTPFEDVSLLAYVVLAFTQVITNRSRLDRAHQEYKP